MALIDFVPTLLIAKHPETGSSWRSRRALQCGVLLSSLAVAGWAAGAESHARGRGATPPPQAEDANGNPEFYEVFGKRYKVRE